jgi:hypothetical protein
MSNYYSTLLPVMKDSSMQTHDPNKPRKLKPADLESIDRLIRGGSRDAAVKLYAGACNCELDEARKELAQLIVARRADSQRLSDSHRKPVQ